MKVYISADIEGTTGLVAWSQCGRPDGQHYDYPFARRMMTHDVNAAIRGARAAGAGEIVVKDSHGSMKNLLIDELEQGVELISGFGSGTHGMMQGIDSSFTAVMLIGYHGMAGTLHGIMEHTISGGVHRLSINGTPSGELALSAGIAGFHGVPVVTVSSDQAGCLEAAGLLPGVETFATKFGLGRYMGRLLHPHETGPGIEAAAKRGLLAKRAKPFVTSGPIKITLEFNRSEDADLCATLTEVTRIDAYACEGVGDDFERAHRAVWNMIETASMGANANR